MDVDAAEKSTPQVAIKPPVIQSLNSATLPSINLPGRNPLVSSIPSSKSSIIQDTETVKLANPQSHQARSPEDNSPDNKAIMMLPGHRTEVFVCSFNPKKHVQLASGYARTFVR
jgi:hypothetical protein